MGLRQTRPELMIPNIFGMDGQWDSHLWLVDFLGYSFLGLIPQDNRTCKAQQYAQTGYI